MPGPQFITDAELADIRQQQADLISEIGTTGTIKRPSSVSDNAGGYTRTFTTIGTDVPMRLWISSGPNGTSEEARFWGEQEVSQTDAFIVLYWDQDIDIKDVIVAKGREWRVVGLQVTDAFLTAKRVRVEAMR